MNYPEWYQYAADIVLFSHLVFVAFVIFGLIIVFAGSAFSWSWVRNPWFRLLHLLSIGVVVIQSWFGVVCPLTTLENWLRRKGGEVTYEGTFISHWMQELLYYDAPAWVFAVVYTSFAALVLASWYFVRPRPLRSGSNSHAN